MNSSIIARRMITLYHGSVEIVERPEIRTPNRTLDFGQGFYLTSSEKQAEDWVCRRLEERMLSTGYVNVYQFDIEIAVTKLRIRTFDLPSEDWVDFVMANRRQEGFTHEYDVVSGPVANDRVYTAFSLYEGGVLGKEALIAELKTYRLVDQYLFHTSRSLSYLKYITSKSISI
jgi:hypothetical protein